VSYLLDTNVVSELARARPEPRVLSWFAGVADEALYLSVLTLGELRNGVESMPSGARRERLRNWLEHDLPGWFEDRLLPVDGAIADRWGRLTASAGRTLPGIDSLLAATAFHHDLRVVTRNASDFDLPGLEVVDPWAS
jgi:predicted nucleic acid-binding protein